MSVVKEIFALIGFKTDLKPLQDAEKAGVQGAEKTENAWAKAGKGVGTALAGVGAAAAAAAAGIFKLVDSSTKAADETAKAARSAGVASDEFQRLTFVAGRGGVGVKELQAGVRNLTTSLDQARRGGAQPFRDALARLGVSVSELGPSAEKNMGIIADALNNVVDDSERAALRIELFGARAGPGLASVLEEGSVGIKAMGDEAERLGMVLSEDALKESEAFQDALGDMRGTIGSLAQQIGISLIPVVKEVIDNVREWVVSNRDLIRERVAGFVKDIIPVLKTMASIIGSLVSATTTLTTAFGPTGLVAALGAAKIAMMALNTQGLTTLGTLLRFGPVLAAIGLAAGTLGAVIDEAGNARDRASGRKAERTAARSDEYLHAKERRRLDRALELRNRELFNARRPGVPRAEREAAQARLAAYEAQVAKYQGLSDARRAATKGLAQMHADAAKDAKLRSLQAAATADTTPTGKGGGRPREVDVSEHEFLFLDEFGDEIQRMGLQLGASEAQISEAIKAGGAALAGHSSPIVAARAAVSRLESLTGGMARQHDPILSEILGEDVPGMPALRLSEITRATDPQVVVNTNNIENNINVEIAVDGAGDPVMVGQNINRTIAEHFTEIFNQLARGQQVNFAG